MLLNLLRSGLVPILARIEERLSELDPDYEVNQIKENLHTGGLTPHRVTFS